MTKRPNALVALGVALFLVGGAIVFFVLRDDGDGEGSSRQVPVVVARDDLAPGAAGSDVLAAGDVVVEQVDESERAADALSSTASLSGQIFTAEVGKGGQVRTSSLRPETLRSASVKIPKGKQAVAVTLPYTAGGAGYAGPGDRVNLFTSIAPDTPGAPESPQTRLLLSNVEVLDVSTEVAPFRAQVSTAGASAPSPAARAQDANQVTLLLALDAAQAEQVVFATNFNLLYATVVPKGHAADTTPGVTYDRGYLPK